MPDVFFKCEACGRHLVIDDSAVGATIDCPHCNVSTMIPEISTMGKCPRCRQHLKFSPQMKAEVVHCPTCRREIRLPGHRYPGICPKCGAGWDPPLHHCQRCSYSMDDAAIPMLMLEQDVNRLAKSA
jgi:DNA-directed RNA polymerase subunit RPC12/RpoP